MAVKPTWAQVLELKMKDKRHQVNVQTVCTTTTGLAPSSHCARQLRGTPALLTRSGYSENSPNI